MDFFYPRRCPICDEVLHIGEYICDGCEKKLIVIEEPMCRRCGKPLERDKEYCGDCEKKQLNWDVEGRAAYLYDEYMKHSIVKFKYKERAEYAVFYAKSIVKYCGDFISDKHIDAIVPVPIHKNKLRIRGYNQAELVAAEMGKLLDIKVYPHALIRIIDTMPQKELDNKNRKSNLMNAIRINHKMNIDANVNNILIVDDIYTTGTTMEVCSKVLKEKYKNINIYFVSVAIGKGQ